MIDVKQADPKIIIDLLKHIIDSICAGDSGQIVRAGIYKHKKALEIELYVREKYVGRIIGKSKEIAGFAMTAQAPMKDAILKILNAVGYSVGINSVDLWVSSLDKYNVEPKEAINEPAQQPA